VIGSCALFGALAMATIAWTPVAASVRVALVLLVAGVTGEAIRAQRFGRHRRALRRLIIEGDCSWLLEFSDGRRRTAGLLASTSRIGSWWFLHWPGAWAIVTPRGIGELEWRRLTARLRDRPVAVRSLRSASSHG
jgi:hypothetical protein